MLSAAAVFARADITPEPLFFDPADTAPPPIAAPESVGSPSLPSVQSVPPAESVEAQINRAVIARDWGTLESLLAQYRTQPQHDTILYRYALGALRRSQLRHPEAVALYRSILAERGDLAYPRFDLGIMLFENRQYREAAVELEQAKPQLNAPLQHVAQQYLDEIARNQKWQPEFGATYERNGNVNNASDERVVVINGRRFTKNPDALPQKAHGIRYQVGLSHDWNVRGNHFAVLGIGLDGVHYWDNQGYNENILRVQAGYRHRTARRTWSIVPFAEQNWLGKARYSRHFGAVAEFSYRITQKWQISSDFSHRQKRYRENALAGRYNGYLNAVSLNVLWQPAPEWVLQIGADASTDTVRDRSESSVRKGVHWGAAYRHRQWGMQGYIRYGTRRFRQENFFSGSTRSDKEYQVNVAVWHNRLAWKGFVPKLNYRFSKIDSNIPSLYSRQTGIWFVSVDKLF